MRHALLSAAILASALAGCTSEDAGPLVIKIERWELGADGANGTLTTRLTNLGESPLWRIRVYVDVTYYSADGLMWHTVDRDARGGLEYAHHGLLGEDEVLRGRSYVDRSVNVSLSGMTPQELRPATGPPAPRHDISYEVDYESSESAWAFTYRTCPRGPDGNEIAGRNCPSWFVFRESLALRHGKPNETIEIGEPLSDHRV